jgi:hypothetical protein
MLLMDGRSCCCGRRQMIVQKGRKSLGKLLQIANENHSIGKGSNAIEALQHGRQIGFREVR